MIIVQTPLRISFAGGGTDFSEFYKNHEKGMVINSAIDKNTFVIVKERFDKKIYLNWMKKEIVNSVQEIEHELIREAMKKTKVSEGIEITTLSDVPSEGSGLGSSSSLTVGLLHALYLYSGRMVDAETLAQESCEIEIEILKKPIGKQDQYITAYGGFKSFEFHSNGKVKYTSIQLQNEKLRKFNSRLLLFFTGKTRNSATILSKQKENIKNKQEILLQMRSQVPTIEKCLKSSQFDPIGSILHQGWLYKKELASNISDPMIDILYEKACNAGAVGGKILGAGGGGFLLLYVQPENQDRVREALAELKELPFSFQKDGSKAIFNVRN
ncbi:MAG: GHMP kinase [Elusimicrobia bacterium RIFCSPLOWO2_02_FULL_39_32]|nr:MAG: GHMP kinase [Elusimicrobia bacterium GWA2_38_7]OGR78437.1 MAG: GHMP kinase [Elusimicrobia bacterium RIFCSPHIGHO2_02_FULL_39_36]OGR92196.1 MAG: GHMP kinase [Elusimicrobia bacterium RIFCSPLOWO2_02_FULL_39_32]OGR99937.1 MAG: GHMP kinase [Elusimicrobia bacterium RIFCSPLOWO2_12_FULL_39_28]